MKAKNIYIAILSVVCLTSCYKPSTPIYYQSLDTVLTSGRLEYYGQFYKREGVDYDVVSLDLYSKGLGLNEEGVMEGTGTNLYISDIFLTGATLIDNDPSSVLPEGTYVSDSTAVEGHFLRGMNYDGNYGGSYVLLMGEQRNYSVLPMVIGEMTVAYVGDTLVLDGVATLDGQKRPYPFHYRNILPTIDRER